MDGRDLDDYERRQSELEFVGLDEDWIEEVQGDRDTAAGEITYEGIVNPAVTVALKFPTKCAGCGGQMAGGDEAIRQQSGERWISFHPAHATLPSRSPASLEPGERLFELRYPQPCVRCKGPMLAGEQAAGTKLERGWAVRHVDCGTAPSG